MKRLLYVLALLFALTPVLLGLLAVGLVERSPVAAIGGALTAVLFFLPLEVLALLFLPVALTPGTSLGSHVRRPAVVASLLLLQLVFSVLSIPAMGPPRPSEFRMFVRSDLRNFASQQEIHFSEHGAYSDDLAAIGFVASSGVTVAFQATERGWSATGTHAANDEISCAVYYGEIGRPPSTIEGNAPAQAGEIICEPVPRLTSWGRMGAVLRFYHHMLDNGLFDISLF